MGEHLLSMCKVLGSGPSITKRYPGAWSAQLGMLPTPCSPQGAQPQYGAPLSLEAAVESPCH